MLFATGFLEAGYRRFVERRLREEFGFAGTPIEVWVRVREKRRKYGARCPPCRRAAARAGRFGAGRPRALVFLSLA